MLFRLVRIGVQVSDKLARIASDSRRVEEAQMEAAQVITVELGPKQLEALERGP